MSMPCTQTHAHWFEAWLAGLDTVPKDSSEALEACADCQQERELLGEVVGFLEESARLESATLQEVARSASSEDDGLIRAAVPAIQVSRRPGLPLLVAAVAVLVATLGWRLLAQSADDGSVPDKAGETFLGTGGIVIEEPVARGEFTGRIRWRCDDPEVVSYAVKIYDATEGATSDSLWSEPRLEAVVIELPPETTREWSKDLYIQLQALDVNGRPVPGVQTVVRTGPGS